MAVRFRNKEEFEKIAEEKCGALSYLSDLVDVVWKDRPPLPTEKRSFG